MAIHSTTAVLTLAFGLALATLGYSSFADARGWPVGRMYREDHSILKIAATLTVFGAPPLAWLFSGSLVSPVGVIVIGAIAGVLAVRLFRQATQLVVPVILPACWILVLGVFLT